MDDGRALVLPITELLLLRLDLEREVGDPVRDRLGLLLLVVLFIEATKCRFSFMQYATSSSSVMRLTRVATPAESGF